jgi:hypothetical protein
VWPLRDFGELDKTLLVCGIVSLLSILAAVAAPSGSERAISHARAGDVRPIRSLPASVPLTGRCAPVRDEAFLSAPAGSLLHVGTRLACEPAH